MKVKNLIGVMVLVLLSLVTVRSWVLSEAEVHWRAFFEDLAGRGLKGMELVVSDDHAGLKAARRAVFPAVPWQRCQFHLRMLSAVGSKTPDGQAMRDIFNSPTLEDAEDAQTQDQETNQALAQWMTTSRG